MPRSDWTERINFFQGHQPRELLARFGTPLYVYNENILRERCRELRKLSSLESFGVNYSVKANSNPWLLRIVKDDGLRADAMSPGELEMDIMAGYEPDSILYISNNNTEEEMRGALDRGCLVSVDSLSQLEMLGSIKSGAPVMIRINPGIGEGHHAKVVTGGANSKFGIDPRNLRDVLTLLEKYELILAGVNQHIGSLFMRPDNYLAACQLLLQIVDHLPGRAFSTIEIIDFGGGFGIPYHKRDGEDRLDMAALGNGLHTLMADWTAQTHYGGSFLVEPGRYVMAECGLLLGTVTAVKNNGHIRFVGTDIGFNVLMRPMLYDAWHDIEVYGADADSEPVAQTVVGNICESGDIIARDRLLPPMKPGDVIGVLDAGAYGFSMASNYNDRLLPAEILLSEGREPRLIRRRQTLSDLKATLLNLD